LQRVVKDPTNVSSLAFSNTALSKQADSLRKTSSDIVKNAYLSQGREVPTDISAKFVKKEDKPDISFIRVGGKSGTIDKKTDDKNIQAHYFIKFTNNKSVDENIKRLSTITYDFNNTVGPKSISKQELIFKFNPLLTEI
jgi:hypothetical protein